MSEKSHKRSQTNLGSCPSKVREESEKKKKKKKDQKTSNMEPDINLNLTFITSGRTIRSDIGTLGH